MATYSTTAQGGTGTSASYSLTLQGAGESTVLAGTIGFSGSGVSEGSITGYPHTRIGSDVDEFGISVTYSLSFEGISNTTVFAAVIGFNGKSVQAGSRNTLGPWPGLNDTEAGVSASYSLSLLGSELTTSFAEHTEFAGKHVQGGQTGAVVPASYFRTLRGQAVDLEGIPITDAIYILALDNFATVGTVDDEAYFEIDLLKTTFQEFRLIVDAGDEQFEYVWYEDENANIDPDPTDQDVTMQFKPAEAIGKAGLNLTGDLSFA